MRQWPWHIPKNGPEIGMYLRYIPTILGVIIKVWPYSFLTCLRFYDIIFLSQCTPGLWFVERCLSVCGYKSVSTQSCGSEPWSCEGSPCWCHRIQGGQNDRNAPANWLTRLGSAGPKAVSTLISSAVLSHSLCSLYVAHRWAWFKSDNIEDLSLWNRFGIWPWFH